MLKAETDFTSSLFTDEVDETLVSSKTGLKNLFVVITSLLWNRTSGNIVPTVYIQITLFLSYSTRPY